MDTANWMKKNINWLGALSIHQLSLGGSHHSGMNQITGGTPQAKSCKVIYQDLTVINQLEKGVRYLDLRPVLSEGKFTTGSYFKEQNNKWQGANGQSIISILEDINNFTKEHNELIIITLSNTLNRDVEEHRPFNQNDWDELFDLLNTTENMFHTSEKTQLEMITLGEITKKGTRAGVFYIVYDEGTGVELGDYAGKGFFYPRNIIIFRSATKTDDPLVMIDQQISLMEKVAPNRYFVMSFILSRNRSNVTVCSKRRNHKRMGQTVNKNLADILYYVTKHIHPNVLMLDYVGHSKVAEVAMSINLKWLSKK